MGRPIEKRHLYVTTRSNGELLLGEIQGRDLVAENGFVYASTAGGNQSGVRFEEIIFYRTESIDRES
ncbi:MAG: hypothetical protein E7A34_00140 [Leclercia adecarboxylata]|nr:hypothetical protein [Leclercia adecarboxylata]MDU1082783.1 hypothetical protein [Leclercia adecarboxylata]